MGQELSRRSFVKIAGITAASGAVLGAFGLPALAATEQQAGTGSKDETAGNLTGYIPKAGKMLRKGDLTSETLIRNYLENIKKLEPKLNAVITLMEAQALAAARTMDAMAGFDPHDQHSSLYQLRGSYTDQLQKGVKGLRIGIVQDYPFKNVDPQVAAAVYNEEPLV